MTTLRVGTDSEGVGKVVFTLVLESEVTNTWRRAFIAASIVAVVTNASVPPCAPEKTCLSIAVTNRSRLSDPVLLSGVIAWQRLKASESVTIGRRKESTSTVLRERGREHGTEGHISARTDRSHCASSTACDTECASAARVLRTTPLIVLLVQWTKCPNWNSPCQNHWGSCVKNTMTPHWLFEPSMLAKEASPYVTN